MTDERTRSNTRVPDPEYDRGQSIPAAETLFDPRRDVIGRGSTTQPPRNTGTTKPKETPRRRATQSSHKPTVQQQPLAPRPSAADQTLPEKAVEDPKAQEEEEEEEEVIPFKQLDVPQIQPDQLIREAKSIYAAMLMVENKCNEVDRQEEAKVRAGDIQSIPATRYKELVVLHRTLLYEQYDFFLACSHPAATQQLRLLPHKYGMPGRIWKSGIHTFLEVLRHHLPESLEHMLTFLHMAYGVVCLLYETIPSHKATWIECLGDLARYRMAVEERDAEIREIWTDRAREWYYAATDIFPSVGRLYHHLAIVARQNPVEQLYLYVKSLTVDLIFTGTRESVLILFQTVSRETPGASLVTSVDYSFVQLHQILFTKVDLDFMRTRAEQFIPLLRSALEYSSDPETPEYWGSRPTHMAICGIGSLYQYGAREGIFRSFNEAPDTSATASGQSVPQNSKDQPTPPPPPKLECADRLEGDEPVTQSQQFILAKELAMQVLQTFLSCNIENAKVLHVQSWMVFLDFFVRHRKGIMENFLEADMPWDQLVQYINTLFRESKDYILDFSPEPVFPAIPNAPASADDYALRALVWASDFHPKGYFTDHLPESDRSYEHPPGTAGAAANLKLRKERILYLAARICVVCFLSLW